MAELLIRIIDRGGVDVAKGYTDSKAGDVIAACPDGWAWSEAERTAPYWRIIQVKLLASETAVLLAVGDGDPFKQRCHKRKYSIDRAQLAAVFPGILDMRTSPILIASNLKKFRDTVLLKPSLAQV
jgi:hypothetical protein